MQFLYPVYLYGLFLVIIPIIIHLFKLRRYQVVYFSSIKFLKEAHLTYKSKSRLKDILLLITRILLITSLVIAFAQPVFKSDKSISGGPSSWVGIYIDASMSMKNQISDGSLFDKAKRKATEIINRQTLETSFTIYNSLEPGSIDILSDRFEALEAVSMLKLNSQVPDFAEILYQFESIRGKNEIKSGLSGVYIISDFQENFFQPDQLPDTSAVPVYLIPLTPDNLSNIFIDTCWLEQPIHHYGSRVGIAGYLTNTGNQEYRQFPLNLSVNDSTMARTGVDLPARGRVRFQISYLPEKNGRQKAKISLNDYPVDFDNNFFFSFNLNEKTRICQLYEDKPNRYIKAGFNEDTAFTYTEYPINGYPGSDFNSYETVIISGSDQGLKELLPLLESFVSQGGNLIVFPEIDDDPVIINQMAGLFQSPSLLGIMTERDIARFSSRMNTFLSEISLNPEAVINWPVITSYNRLSRLGSNVAIILESSVGRPILISTKHNQGSFVLSTLPLEQSCTSLGEHPLFIPLLYYLATAEARAVKLYSRLSDRQAFQINLGQPLNQPISLKEPVTGFSIIPQQEFLPNDSKVRIFLTDWHGGSGFLYAGNNSIDPIPIAINYPAEESGMVFYNSADLERIISEYGSQYLKIDDLPDTRTQPDQSKKRNDRLPYQKIFFLVALLMIFAETAILRYKS